MRSTFISVLACISTILADYNVTFVTESDISEVDGMGLQFLHEGAGSNNVFLSADSGSELTYSESTNEFYLPELVGIANGSEVEKWNLTVPPTEGVNFYPLSVGVNGGPGVYAEKNYLAFNGSTTFYAAKYLNDHYGYTYHQYEVLATKIPGSHELKIRIA